MAETNTDAGVESERDSETGAAWQDLATELHERGGVPQTRARVVALIAQGHTHSETQEILGLESRGNVATHVKRYRERDLPQAEWLASEGPEI